MSPYPILSLQLKSYLKMGAKLETTIFSTDLPFISLQLYHFRIDHVSMKKLLRVSLTNLCEEDGLELKIDSIIEGCNCTWL
jgi:hypothetical protein